MGALRSFLIQGRRHQPHAFANSYAGSIIAALFLERFVTSAPSWFHADIFAWNASAKPARPEGGEAQAIRALYAYLAGRYGP